MKYFFASFILGIFFLPSVVHADLLDVNHVPSEENILPTNNDSSSWWIILPVAGIVLLGAAFYLGKRK